MAKVLIVDDEEELRTMMGRQLRRAGHEIVQAQDGLAAVALLERDSFDVIVSDMKMPRLDGMGLLARITEMVLDSEFIILTGHGSMENAVEAFKTGRVFDYLLKPLEDIRELDTIVARAAERHHLKSENNRLIGELKARIEDLEEAKRRLAELASAELNQAKLLAEQTARRYHDLFQEVPVACCSFDSNGLVIDWNRAFERLIGYSANDIRNRQFSDIVGGPKRPELQAILLTGTQDSPTATVWRLR
jgi:CheY-like chemotaxis protein